MDIKKDIAGLSILQSHLFCEYDLIHAFTSRRGGFSKKPFHALNLGYHVGDHPHIVRRNREKVARALGIFQSQWVNGEQIHSNRVKIIKKLPPAPRVISGTDAIITDQPEIILVAFFADCVPVYLFDPERKVWALAHAGWRGTVGKVSARTLKTMQVRFGSHPKSCLGLIGPAVGPCCYEVDEYVLNPLAEAFPNYWENFIKNGTGQKKYLDLKAVNAFQLRKAGIAKNKIEVSSLCTCCSPELFFSFRRSQGPTGRMAAILGMNKS